MRLVAECPGKINLMLRVVDRRPDGFHELETLFQAVALHDEVEVTLSPADAGVSLAVEGADLGSSFLLVV